jgi:hypothetical protein
MTTEANNPSSELEKRLAAMTPVELEERRRQIVASANGKYEALPTEQLQEMAFIVATLRRRNSGPPKSTNKPARKPATIDNLLDI